MDSFPLLIGRVFQTLLAWMTDWNLVLLIIFGCSLIAITIFCERVIALKKSEIDTNRFIIRIRKSIQEGDVVQGIHICEETGGTIANIIRSGLLKHEESRDKIENAMEVRGMIEIAALEKNAKVLSIIAHVAPLIGLLGTVLGFIQAFSEMRQSGLMDISTTHIGSAMEYALETTAAGLVVAIPTVIAYNYIVGRVEAFLLEIQTSSSEIIELLMSQREEKGMLV